MKTGISLSVYQKLLWKLESSVFTKLSDYSRHIMVLEGETRLEHKDHHSIALKPFMKDFFQGGWDTVSFGACSDFNLMLGKGYTGDICTVKDGFLKELANGCHIGFYCLSDSVSFIMDNGEESRKEILNKGDFIQLNVQSGRESIKICVSKTGSEDYLAAAAMCKNITAF